MDSAVLFIEDQHCHGQTGRKHQRDDEIDVQLAPLAVVALAVGFGDMILQIGQTPYSHAALIVVGKLKTVAYIVVGAFEIVALV